MKTKLWAIAGLLLGCSYEPPPVINETVVEVQPAIISSVPTYVSPGVGLSLTTPAGIAHRLQISAVGEPFTHPIDPAEFHFYGMKGGTTYSEITGVLSFTGCITRGTDTVLCDIDVTKADVPYIYDLCYRNKDVPYTPVPDWAGPGGFGDLCLKYAIAVTE